MYNFTKTEYIKGNGTYGALILSVIVLCFMCVVIIDCCYSKKRNYANF